ncbi:hypothetical protein PHYSODRAFT_297526 [Phytophthora sojae]|uniref:Uncharacterized protein n=1 Tax=Phytophthora sojae (strain P6497) TaxID=1094619 RepID=G4YXD0_PHYSP|nr:hypothetical protein PHYSODRAFT_297526 [Phytophthora sojae]EGZ26164.1 hypothetical protein PHYSODRAFT_297526 [Phytophthora sojae]|eukprot:XP_009521452.1 hypothetical protein PHYSODRAFT_297526 [Phytophthora sojae]
MNDLWSYLQNEVVAGNRRPLVVGPSGVGKSASVLSFAASLDRVEWSVIWIHLGVVSSCLVMRTKKWWRLVDLNEYMSVLPRVADEKLFVFVDGYKNCKTHEEILPNILARLCEEDRLVVCSPMAALGKRNAQNDALLRIKAYFMSIWKPSPTTLFMHKLDAASVYMYNEVNAEDGCGEEGHNDEEKRNHALKLKFYYAGGSCRFMFQFTATKVKEILHMALVSTKKLDLSRYCCGFYHSDTTNTFSGMQRAARDHHPRLSPVSSFAVSHLAEDSEEIVISELVVRFDDSDDDPPVDRFVFEWLFFASVSNRKLKLFGIGGCVDVLPQARVLQFNPKKGFRKLTGMITRCYADNTYDIVYAGGERDTRIADLIQDRDGEKNQFEKASRAEQRRL